MENIEKQLAVLKGIDWDVVKNECLEYALYYAATHENIEYAEIKYLTPENAEIFGAEIKKPLDNNGLLRCFCLINAIVNALESNKRLRSESSRNDAAQRTRTD